MKNNRKKALSLFLAIAMVMTSLSFSLTSFADDSTYLDTNGDMVKLCDDDWLTFETDYDDVREELKNAFTNRQSSVTLRFACSEDEEFFFDYSDEVRDEYCKKFINRLFFDVFLDDDPTDPYDGEYLYHSLTGNFDFSAHSRPNENDIIAGKTYTNYEVSFSNIKYYTTVEQENKIKNFVSEFNTKFATSTLTPYETVKTIYDFVVRNTEYDDDVFHGKYAPNSSRYNIAHSAIGAISGNLTDEAGVQTKEYDWTVNNFILNQNIISQADQGLAVCEGISKLFYVLCEANGIRCKIIDGDYTASSGKDSDPHEWVQVYLNDGIKADGARWYLIDPTFAIQSSIKEIHFNNYDYFLRGSDGDAFAQTVHQTAYTFENQDIYSTEINNNLLYDLHSDSYRASAEDYEISPPEFTEIIDDNAMILIERSYVLNGNERGAYILTNSKQTKRVEFDDEGNVKYDEDVKGFVYNGLNCIFTAWVPYIPGIEINVNGDMKNVGTCSFSLVGKGDTSYTYYFEIVPNDMTADFNKGSFSDDKYSDESSVKWQAGYTGNTISPEVEIVDGYHNTLVEGRDYIIKIYDDSHTTKATLKDFGKYYIDIEYINNYCGVCSIEFLIGKINLNEMNDYTYNLNYYPKKVLAKQGITTPAQEFVKATANGLTIGDYKIKPNEDFTVASTGTLTYGASGTLTLTGMSSSTLVSAGTKKQYAYKISKRYDISTLNNTWAETKPFYNTGSAVKPTKFTQLDSNLEQGVDYKITGYKNNVANGKASVIIQGINGCTGTAEMYFQITDDPNRPNIKNASVSYSNDNNTFKYSLKVGSKTLVKDRDYKESVKVSNGKGIITCTGINNYQGTLTINLPSAIIPPSSSGNYLSVASSVTYTGKALKPTVKLYNSSKKLVNNFFISSKSYSNNTKVGLGKVTVKTKTGKTVTKTFKINPVKTSVTSLSAGKKSFTVKWSKKTSQVSGYQIQYSTSSKFTKPKTITISKNSTTSYTKKSLSAKKKYYVRVRTYKTVGSTKYYSGWSSAKSVTTKK
ncbi:MAG: transglutaminase domain-containing protein [Eubacterium sp.]